MKSIKGERYRSFPPGHIVTKPQNRRQRAATALLQIMAYFNKAGNKARKCRLVTKQPGLSRQ